MSYLGIDLGTSGLRALLVDDEGRPLGAAERHYAVANPASGWSEQDPADWIAAFRGAVADLRAAHPQFAGLRGIGVAGHMHGATVLDAADRVLRPCILWNDTRSHVQAAALDADPRFRDLTGNIVFPGFTAPKLAWMAAHEPDLFARAARVLLPAAYLNLWLTGEHVGDLSDASGTAWLDTGARDWSDELLAATTMTRTQMPRLVEGSEAAGHLRADLAAEWGLDHPVTVAGGAGDNAAAACGIGAMAEGAGFVSLGTSGVLLAARDGYAPAPDTALHSFCHAVPGRWYQMGVMLAATDCLNWLGRITGTSPAALTADLGPLRAPGPVRFLPYLSGERTPHNDPAIRGSFTGLASATGRDDLARAVLEGVAFGLADSLAALQATGAHPTRLMAIGGGARSRTWLQIIATALDVTLTLPEAGEFGAALGAARLGMVAAGGGSVDQVMTAPDITDEIAPDPALRGAFDAALQGFRTAYPAIRAVQ
ncbi:xylulokinase [Paracoccus gahaiensis]|uniref:Xylulose kinase n=1 Tax=Paracoccus gahaiensis TaxID=1706839 RepID=A0A4U0R9Q1_9RHOB|nr:xylulokinase [Paracoccus gahaiensis]TJZ91931.1 xylulokinase [Paracoccus gahaiensis]